MNVLESWFRRQTVCVEQGQQDQQLESRVIHEEAGHAEQKLSYLSWTRLVHFPGEKWTNGWINESHLLREICLRCFGSLVAEAAAFFYSCSFFLLSSSSLFLKYFLNLSRFSSSFMIKVASMPISRHRFKRHFWQKCFPFRIWVQVPAVKECLVEQCDLKFNQYCQHDLKRRK